MNTTELIIKWAEKKGQIMQILKDDQSATPLMRAKLDELFNAIFSDIIKDLNSLDSGNVNSAQGSDPNVDDKRSF